MTDPERDDWERGHDGGGYGDGDGGLDNGDGLTQVLNGDGYGDRGFGPKYSDPPPEVTSAWAPQVYVPTWRSE